MKSFSYMFEVREITLVILLKEIAFELEHFPCKFSKTRYLCNQK
jgi:hypothetical protein